VVAYDNENELEKGIDVQKILIALNIDAQFSKNVLERKEAKVQLIIDGRKSNSGQIAAGYINVIIDQYNRDLGFIRSVEVVNRNWYNSNLIYSWFTLSGLIGVLTMLTTLSVTALSIARERELGTFDQLLITPLSPTEILIGKSIPAILIGIIEGSLMLIAGILMIDLPMIGSLLALYIGMTVFVLAIVGVGMFISSISRTQQQATLGIFLVMVPSVVLSGFATPVTNMPDWLQYISNVNALKYFIFIVRGVTMKGIPFNIVIENVIPMILIAGFTLLSSIYFFKSEVGK